MNTKLYDSELKVMEVLWKEGDDSAKHISEILNAEIGWNKNTTYTVIKKCVAKGAIERYGSNYMCKPLISKENVEELVTLTTESGEAMQFPRVSHKYVREYDSSDMHVPSKPDQ